jgi:hypothetical protein
MGLRILVSSAVAGPAMLFGVKALMLYENLPVLAMLPVRLFISRKGGDITDKDRS